MIIKLASLTHSMDLLRGNQTTERRGQAGYLHDPLGRPLSGVLMDHSCSQFIFIYDFDEELQHRRKSGE